MTLTQQQKANLSNNLDAIQKQFTTYKTGKAYMAVYFSPINKPYLTFGQISVFPETFTMGKSPYTLYCVYNTNENFTAQSNAFLA